MKSARWGDFGLDVRLVAAVPRTHEPPVSLSTTDANVQTQRMRDSV